MQWPKSNFERNFFSVFTLIMLAICCIFSTYACKNDTKSNTSPQKSNSNIKFKALNPQATGINTINKIVEDHQKNIINFEYYFQGAGVAIADFDNDGLQDAYIARNMVSDRIYQNKSGLKFEDRTENSGLNKKRGWNCGIAVVDINNDQLPDIYISRGGGFNKPLRSNSMYINKGNFKFEEQAKAMGIDDAGFSSQSTFFDYDNDGDLDLFVVNTPRCVSPVIAVAFADKSTYSLEFSDKLYRNDSGKFTLANEAAGIPIENGFGLGVVVFDINQDGYEDLYVSNDYDAPDYLYINNGKGGFTEELEKYMGHVSNYSMGCVAGDINNDQLTDLLVLDMLAEDYKRSKTMMGAMNVELFWKVQKMGGHFQYMRNMLQLNNGNGSFSEIGQLAGIAKTDWSWSPLMGDFNNDGLQDIFVTNGIKRDITNKDFTLYINEQAKLGAQGEKDVLKLLDKMPSEPLENYLFQNTNGIQFKQVTNEAGVGKAGFSSGAAYGDLDNDGDLDVIINNINEEPFVYQNQSSQNYLQFQLKADQGTTVGTEIRLTACGQTMIRRAQNVSGYLSSNSPIIHFGLADCATIESITVKWKNGTYTQMENVKANEVLKLTMPKSSAKMARRNEKSILTEVNSKSLGIDITHQENEFNDFEDQILLPYQLSKEGPALAIGDVNKDGLEDLFIGGAKGQAGSIYLQTKNGKFEKKTEFAREKNQEDATAVFFDADGDEDLDLYVGSGGNEWKAQDANYQDRLYINYGQGNFSKTDLPKFNYPTATVLNCDFDKDGDMDLFVSARHQPGQYGHSAPAILLQNNGSVFKDVTQALAPALNDLGMITSVSCLDLDQNGYRDFVLNGDWMSMQILSQTKEGFKLNSDGFPSAHGWWNCILAEDFNEDGKPDFVLGNLGTNTKYTSPCYLDVGDFDQNGDEDLIISTEVENNILPVRGRECISWQIPQITEEYKTYAAFAEASTNDLVKQDKNAKRLKADQLQSGIYMSDGTSYRFEALPIEAQFAPIKDMIAIDLVGDKKKELVTVGNFYPFEVETGKSDAGTGNIISFDAVGKMKNIKPVNSNFYATKDARRVKAIKINGTEHIVVANNNGPLQFFKVN